MLVLEVLVLEVLVVFVVVPCELVCELVVGVPLTVTIKARHAVRRIDWNFMVADCGDVKGDV